MRCLSAPLLFAALLPWSCIPTSSVAAEADDAHDHAESIQFTLWEQGYELFVEYGIPVRGEEVEFVTHVTDTGTGAPRRLGSAVFRLRGPDGSQSEHTEETPVRDGIYLPHLSFASVGVWRVEIVLASDSQTTTISFPPVKVYADEHTAAHASVPEPPEGISFLKEQQWRLGTRIHPLRRRSLVNRIEVPGIVHAAQERQAIVTPPIAGRLETVDGGSFPHLGTRVEEGQILGFVRPPFSDYMARMQEAEADIVRAQLNIDRTQLVLDRVQALHAQKARSKSELEKATFDVQLALADYVAAEAIAQALRGSGIEVSPTGDVRFALRSPIGGNVVEVEAVNGSYVDVGVHLVHVRDSSFVHLEALVRPESLAVIANRERPIFVRTRGASSGTALLLPRAKLTFIGDEIDPHTLTVPMHFEVANPDNKLRIGELIELQFPIGAERSELALPVGALVEEDGEQIVFVQVTGEVFERRFPQLGFRDGEFIQVVGGIQEGEYVVTHGPYAVRLAGASGDALGHGHAH